MAILGGRGDWEKMLGSAQIKRWRVIFLLAKGSSSNVLVRVVVEHHLKTPTAVHPYDEHA